MDGSASPSNPGIGHDRSAISHCLYFRASSMATNSLENAFTLAFVAANCKVVNAPALSRSAALLSD